MVRNHVSDRMTVATMAHPEATAPRRRQPLLRIGIGLLLGTLALGVGYGTYAYAASPVHVRQPSSTHYHLRMQVVVNGEVEDFGGQEYQKGYPKDLCSAALVEQPIHFHDNRDQFVHIHWKGITGGEVLKYYGWNFIGGLPNALGYKVDDVQSIVKVTTHGNYLPAKPKDAQYYVYTGDETRYQEQAWQEFLEKDLEDFFGKRYSVQYGRTGLARLLIPRAVAHSDPGDAAEDGQPGSETEQDRLARINTLVGNVVIFAQQERPTDEQIKDRFTKLVPLAASTCGG